MFILNGIRQLALISITIIISSASAYGSNAITDRTSNFPPTGSKVGASAGHCSVGPFGRTGNTDLYAKVCNRLTFAEKCFAYLKQHIRDDGMVMAAVDPAKAVFCLGVLSSGVNKKR